MQWLFIHDWMRTYTGYLPGNTKLRVFLRKMKEKTEWLFVRDRTHTSTGYSSGT